VAVAGMLLLRSSNSTEALSSFSSQRPPQAVLDSRWQADTKNNVCSRATTDLDEEDLFLLAAAEDLSILNEMSSKPQIECDEKRIGTNTTSKCKSHTPQMLQQTAASLDATASALLPQR
jgi:predicted ATP-grasp superfamily ATP-dependent carboligase